MATILISGQWMTADCWWEPSRLWRWATSFYLWEHPASTVNDSRLLMGAIRRYPRFSCITSMWVTEGMKTTCPGCRADLFSNKSKVIELYSFRTFQRGIVYWILHDVSTLFIWKFNPWFILSYGGDNKRSRVLIGRFEAFRNSSHCAIHV